MSNFFVRRQQHQNHAGTSSFVPARHGTEMVSPPAGASIPCIHDLQRIAGPSWLTRIRVPYPQKHRNVLVNPEFRMSQSTMNNDNDHEGFEGGHCNLRLPLLVTNNKRPAYSNTVRP